MRTEVMAVLPPVPAGACLLLSVLACWPALVRAWRSPSLQVFAWGVVSALVFFSSCSYFYMYLVRCSVAVDDFLTFWDPEKFLFFSLYFHVRQRWLL